MESITSCPKCRTNDRIEMLSAIIAHDTHKLNGTTLQQDNYKDKDGHWHTGTYNAPFTGTQTSQLAIRISFPEKPAPKSFSLLLTIFAWLMAIGGAFFHITAFFAVILIPFLVLAAVPTIPDLGPFFSEVFSNPLEAILATLSAAVSSGIGLISTCGSFLISEFVAIGLPIIIFRKRKKHQIKENYRVAYELPIWQKAKSKWDSLYYCYRDDLIFDPTNNSSFAPNQIIDYCYKY